MIFVVLLAVLTAGTMAQYFEINSRYGKTGRYGGEYGGGRGHSEYHG